MIDANTFVHALKRRAILLCALFLAGCATPVEVLAPVAERTVPADASHVSMLVATSRQPSGDPGTLFSGERGRQLSLAAIDVSIPPDATRHSGTVQWPRRLPPDPRKDFAVTRVEAMSVPQVREWLRKDPHHGRALVFVHGFNNRFSDAVFRFAQIVHDSQADVAPILFTWPSRGRLLDYVYDRESANYSRTAFERGLKALVLDPDVKDITILAHSMGTWLTVESLRQMAIREGNIPSKIKNVILASPDLDVDVFARQWTEMGTKRPKFTIFVSQDDKALAASRLLSGGITRVGAINPAEEPYRSAIEQAGITVIDLTKLKTGDKLNHGKFAESPEIVQLIGKRIATGQAMTATNAGLGSTVGAMVLGTANVVGTVAAKSISAPLDMIEQRPESTGKASVGEILQSNEEAQVD
ncbi:MAG TPA: alpha/beta hydrolase [Rhizobiaceae bacterium]|nr:alpha/beta hydrolase [Rhizobiaceae bacterium]